MVQHRASSFRHRTHAAGHRALRPIDRTHHATRRHARCRLRGPSDSFQGHRTATAQRTACRLDQSTQKGNQPPDHHTHLLVKLVNKCVSSPLTCSVDWALGYPFEPEQTIDPGCKLETAVFLHWRRQRDDLAYLNADREVDLVVNSE